MLPHVTRLAATPLPTRYGIFTIAAYLGPSGHEQVVMSVGDLANGEPALIRLHSECLTGDLFGSHRCDCGEQLDASLRHIQAHGRGAVLYLRGHEGRGIGLANKIRAYTLQAQGLDTVDANRALGLPEDARDYSEAAAILTDLGIIQVRLLTNNPSKIAALTHLGITVLEHVPLHIEPNDHNANYITTKQVRMGHFVPSEQRLTLG